MRGLFALGCYHCQGGQIIGGSLWTTFTAIVWTFLLLILQYTSYISLRLKSGEKISSLDCNHLIQVVRPQDEGAVGTKFHHFQTFFRSKLCGTYMEKEIDFVPELIFSPFHFRIPSINGCPIIFFQEPKEVPFHCMLPLLCRSSYFLCFIPRSPWQLP